MTSYSRLSHLMVCEIYVPFQWRHLYYREYKKHAAPIRDNVNPGIIDYIHSMGATTLSITMIKTLHLAL